MSRLNGGRGLHVLGADGEDRNNAHWDSRLRDGFLCGSSRELGLLNHGRGLGGGSRRSAAAAEHLLDLAGVVASILLADGRKLANLLLGDVSDLASLGADGVGRVLQVAVDKLLVRGVDEGNEERGSGPNKSEAPEWDELD